MASSQAHNPHPPPPPHHVDPWFVHQLEVGPWDNFVYFVGTSASRRCWIVDPAWDIERIIRDYADAAERMKAAGVDGIELEAYGHLMDQFWSPLTNDLDGPYGGSLDNRLRFTFDTLTDMVTNIRSASVSDHIGIVGLELDGDQGEIDSAVKWIAEQGVKVEPIEKNVIE